MVIPFNRFVTFIKPWLNVLAGAVAAWLVAKANLLGIPGLDEANTATWISGAIAWALTTGAVQLGDLKWLQGHHITLGADGRVAAAAIAREEPPVTADTVTDAEVDDVPDAQLPSDTEEFGAPPPDESNTPVQPSQGAVTGDA